MPTHMEIVLRAAAFAAEKHRSQRRKDEEASPYINHPLQVAHTSHLQRPLLPDAHAPLTAPGPGVIDR